MDNVLELVVILAMLASNAIFAAYEMAIASVSLPRLQTLLQQGRRGAKAAVEMKNRLEGCLAVIQLGITLAGAIAAATGGAAADEQLAPWLRETLGVSDGVAETLALVLFVIPLSAATIVFAELIPKMVGIRSKERVVLSLSPAMRAMSRVFHPVVFVFETVVKKMMRLWPGHREPGKTPDDPSGLVDLRAAVSLARASRLIGPMEERILVSAVQLPVRHVAEAMVSAADIATIPAGASLADALAAAHLHMHTRYPVCTEEGNIQSIAGYVTFKDIVIAPKFSPGGGVAGIIRPIRRIPATTTFAKALADMIRDRVHIELVVEGDTIRGLITMEDLVEELVGDIRDEYDRLPAHLTPMGEGWLVGGGVPMAELAKVVGGSVLSGADGRMSLAEWVERLRGTSPRNGDTIRTDGAVIEIRKVRRNRVAEAWLRRSTEADARRTET